MSGSLKTGGPAAPRPVSVFLRRARPGRVVLEFVLPGAQSHNGAPLDIKNMPSWLDALLARAEGAIPADGCKVFGDLSICVDSRLVKFGNKVIPDLTTREIDLLLALAAAGPAVISRENIVSKVWKTVAVPNLVHTHIFNLRRKLPPALAARIQAVPGKGFRYFNPSVVLPRG
ncbi:MAG: winged helix-turn-helix domain-containing protein [Elusimicrobiales bacterium]